MLGNLNYIILYIYIIYQFHSLPKSTISSFWNGFPYSRHHSQWDQVAQCHPDLSGSVPTDWSVPRRLATLPGRWDDDTPGMGNMAQWNIHGLLFDSIRMAVFCVRFGISMDIWVNPRSWWWNQHIMLVASWTCAGEKRLIGGVILWKWLLVSHIILSAFLACAYYIIYIFKP